jgi:hypothetical protein
MSGLNILYAHAKYTCIHIYIHNYIHTYERGHLKLSDSQARVFYKAVVPLVFHQHIQVKLADGE